MIQAIISLIINGLFSFLGKKKAQSIESENKALKGRAKSIEESFEEQEKAQKEAEIAKNKIRNQNDPNNIFGANSKKEIK